MSNKYFPFEFFPMNGTKCLFLQNVEAALQKDLQNKDTFGCKIKDCHTHAGSKVHFLDFIEAEILFHNNYYSRGFAYLTVEEILGAINENTKNVYLVGYESYSELYLRDVQRQFKKAKKDITCEYFIYESVLANDGSGRKGVPSIRNLYEDKDKDKNPYCCYGLPSNKDGAPLQLADCLLVYIVPINTTLTTMDKMIALFESKLESSSKPENDTPNKLYLCLITIGPKDKVKNIYWTKKDSYNSKDILEPKKDRFGKLKSTDQVISFAFTESTWTYAKVQKCSSICKNCYPDKNPDQNDKTLTAETPIFDVTRGSVVPMLQLGLNHLLSPLPPLSFDEKTDDNINLRRVWELSEYTSYHHISRGNNHYQFYVDAPGFLAKYRDSVIEYLKALRNPSGNQADKNQPIIYNYIVAPSHRTNASWVDLVYSTVFANDEDESRFNREFHGARMLYFDISKEYRSNFKAKYSDFLQSFSNIISNDPENYEIRFHFVDETIASGSRFLRAADLVRSLIRSIDLGPEQLERIKLFHSVYLLYGRASNETRKFYFSLFNNEAAGDINSEAAEEIEKFHEYIHVSISQMRNYKDSCVLCKMSNDYRLIRRNCATHAMAKYCGDVINAHEPKKAMDLASHGEFYCSDEKRLLFLISHILNTRLRSKNTPLFNGEAQKQIDVESTSKEVEDLLSEYYQNLQKWLTISIPEFQVKESDFQAAFIKAISRPFLIFHLRKRQAAFAFCLKQLDTLRKNKGTSYDERVKALVNALADMNANYLIRQEPFTKLTELTGTCDGSAEHFCRAIKKMMALSQDTTKSLLLERILVSESEEGFFSDEDSKEDSEEEKSTTSNPVAQFVQNRVLSLRGVLYVENNRIVNDALADIGRAPTLTESPDSMPYYLDNFVSLCNTNGSELDKKFGKNYQSLIDSIQKETKLPFGELNETINGVKRASASAGESSANWTVTPFVRIKNTSEDKNNFNKLFEFILFTEDEDTPLEKRKKFYHDTNTRKLRALFETYDNSSSAVSDDIVFYNDGEKGGIVCIRFLPFAQGGKTNANEKKADEKKANEQKADHALYLLIDEFDKTQPWHWFRLKVLLSLRAVIADLLAAINMPEAIERRWSEMLRKAIHEQRSQMHSEIQKTLFLKFWEGTPSESGIGEIIKNLGKPLCDLTKAVHLLYCLYFSRLSDELLASWYRRIIRLEAMDKSTKLPVWQYTDETIQLVNEPVRKGEKSAQGHLRRIFNATDVNFDAEGKIGSFTYYRAVTEPNEIGEINVSIQLIGDASQHAIRCLAINGDPAAQSIFFIIALLINNAATHGKVKDVDLIFDCNNTCIRVENEVPNDEDMNSDKLDECLNILPFVRNPDGDKWRGGGITLWTLRHLTKEKGWLKAEYKADPNGSTRFVVTLNKSICAVAEIGEPFKMDME